MSYCTYIICCYIVLYYIVPLLASLTGASSMCARPPTVASEGASRQPEEAALRLRIVSRVCSYT